MDLCAYTFFVHWNFCLTILNVLVLGAIIFTTFSTLLNGKSTKTLAWKDYFHLHIVVGYMKVLKSIWNFLIMRLKDSSKINISEIIQSFNVKYEYLFFTFSCHPEVGQSRFNSDTWLSYSLRICITVSYTLRCMHGYFQRGLM